MGLLSISGAAAAAFALAWHRTILLDEEVDSPVRRHAWSRRDLPFFGRSLVLGLLPSIAVSSIVAGRAALPIRIAGGVLFVGTFYVQARLSVVLPSTATGGATDVRSGWALSRGAGVAARNPASLVGTSFGAQRLLAPVSRVGCSGSDSDRQSCVGDSHPATARSNDVVPVDLPGWRIS